MNIACPHCQGLMVGDGIAPGSPVLCPHCQNQFTMSAPAAPSAPAPQPQPQPQPQAPQFTPPGPPQGPVNIDPTRSAGPAPAAARGPSVGPSSAPAPAVQAVWSDVGRRSKGVDSSKMMLGVGIGILILGVIIAVFVFVLFGRPAAKPGGGANVPGSDIVDLDAEIKCSPTEVTVLNKDAFEWKNVVVRINSNGSKGGYSCKVERRMKSGIYAELPYHKFKDSAGTTFDTAGEGVRSVFVEAEVPDVGRGQCTAALK